MTTRDRVRRFIARQRPRGTHYQSRTSWLIAQELRRIESKRGGGAQAAIPGDRGGPKKGA